MINFLTVIIIIVLNAFSFVVAEDCVSCDQTDNSIYGPLPSSQLSPAKNFDTWVSGQLSCKEHDFLKDAQENYIQAKRSDKSRQVSERIEGQTIKGSEREIEFLKRMLGTKPPVEIKSAPKCSEILCMLEKGLGSRELALRSLAIAHKSNYTVSLHQAERVPAKWNAREIRGIENTLNALGPEFSNLKSMKEFIKLPEGWGEKSEERQTGMAWAVSPWSGGGSIIFSSRASRDGDISFMHTMVHEMSHQFDFNAKFSETGSVEGSKSKDGAFKNLNGWRKDQNKDWKGRTMSGGCFVSDYSRKNILEDFAESMTSQIMFPNYTKSLCPKHSEELAKLLPRGFQSPLAPIDNLLGTIQRECTRMASYSSEYKSADGYQVQLSELASAQVSAKKIPTFTISTDCVHDHLQKNMNSLRPILACRPFSYDSLLEGVVTLLSRSLSGLDNSLVASFVLDAKSQEVNKCLQNKNLSEACINGALSKNMTTLMNEGEFKGMFDAAKLHYDPQSFLGFELTAEAFSKADRTKMITRCLKSRMYVSARKLVDSWKLLAGADCAEPALEVLRKSGHQIPAGEQLVRTVIIKDLTGPDVVERVKKLHDRVLTPTLDLLVSCRKEKSKCNDDPKGLFMLKFRDYQRLERDDAVIGEEDKEWLFKELKEISKREK